MNKIITLESGQELLLAANGATPIRYKMVFGSDLMVDFNQITNGKKDEGEAADVIQKLAFIMNNQAVTPKEELAKLREITVDSSLNAPDTLPKPIMQRLIDKAIADKVWSDADIAIYEEKKADKSFNMNFLFNFLSDAAKAGLAGLAMDDKANIVADKIFAGLAEGRVTKQMKEICLLDQTYVRAEDGKQTVAAYLKSVDANLVIKKAVRFEVGEGMQKKSENFAEEVAAQLG